MKGDAVFCCTVFAAHPLNVMVLMLKPSVGLMVVMSSPLSFLTMVVLPALSRPLRHTESTRQDARDPLPTLLPRSALCSSAARLGRAARASLLFARTCATFTASAL